MADLGRAALKKASSGRENGEVRKRQIASEEMNSGLDATAAVEPVQSTASAIPFDANGTTSIGLPDATQLTSDLSSMDGGISATALGLDPSISPDWLNFDTAFENFDAVLGSSGADVSMELLRPFNFDEFGSYGFTN
jgi:hypothetical protein